MHTYLSPDLSPEVFWTVMTAAITSLMWIPHVTQRLLEMGILAGFRDPTHDYATKAAWAQRSIKAHTNAVENLIVFAVLAFAIQFSGKGTETTALAAEVFWMTRLAHYLAYVFGVPWTRSPLFIVGFVCQMILLITVLCTQQ